MSANNNDVSPFAATSSVGDDDHDARTTTAPRLPSRGKGRRRRHVHTLAIMTMPRSASARIANEAILKTAVSVTSKRLSVVLRSTASVDDHDEDVISLT